VSNSALSQLARSPLTWTTVKARALQNYFHCRRAVTTYPRRTAFSPRYRFYIRSRFARSSRGRILARRSEWPKREHSLEQAHGATASSAPFAPDSPCRYPRERQHPRWPDNFSDHTWPRRYGSGPARGFHQRRHFAGRRPKLAAP